MSRAILSGVLILTLLGSGVGYLRAQAPSNNKQNMDPTNVTLVDPSQISKELAPYKYNPVDPLFWGEVESDLETENFPNLIIQGSKQIKQFGADSDEAFEGHLAVGIGFRKLNLYFAATRVFGNIVKKRLGSQLAQMALLELSRIAQENFYDKVEFGDDLLISNEFGDVHPQIQNFVSFHLAFYNLVNGYRDWSDPEFSKIQTESYWGQKINYYKALAEVARGLTDSAESRLYSIFNNTSSDTQLKTQSQLQLARLNFEKKEFARAAQLYETLGQLPLREKGRVLLELAWTKYYLRDYSKALGILTALKAPLFNPSLLPERYILEMIMYKQLCYFDEVSTAAKEFYSRFQKAIDTVSKRGELKTEPTLASIAMLDHKLQYMANLLNQIRVEYDEINEYNSDVYPDFNSIMEAYRLKDKELQQRLYLALEAKVLESADLVLDVEEQVKFLDYTARLDSLRIVRQGEEQEYQSEKINFIKFDKIYWPIDTEFWMDEIDDIKVLINAKCDGSLPTQPTNRELIDKFGEEFE